MILTEADRLKVVYDRARRRRLGEKRGQRPGRYPNKESFILEARSRVLAEWTFSRPEITELDRELLLKPEQEPDDENASGVPVSKRVERWRRSYAYKQMRWQEGWENLREAQGIARLVGQRGSLSAAAIRQTRGFSKWRLDELTPLILGLNLSLELRISGLTISAGDFSAAKIQEILRRVRGKKRSFRALPKGSPELVARVAAINRRIEERSRPLAVRLTSS